MYRSNFRLPRETLSLGMIRGCTARLEQISPDCKFGLMHRKEAWVKFCAPIHFCIGHFSGMHRYRFYSYEAGGGAGTLLPGGKSLVGAGFVGGKKCPVGHLSDQSDPSDWSDAGALGSAESICLSALPQEHRKQGPSHGGKLRNLG